MSKYPNSRLRKITYSEPIEPIEPITQRTGPRLLPPQFFKKQKEQIYYSYDANIIPIINTILENNTIYNYYCIVDETNYMSILYDMLHKLNIYKLYNNDNENDSEKYLKLEFLIKSLDLMYSYFIKNSDIFIETINKIYNHDKLYISSVISNIKSIKSNYRYLKYITDKDAIYFTNNNNIKIRII